MKVLAVFAFATVCAFLSTTAQSGLFVYPQQGQGREQQDQDEYQCYKWAKDNSGVDPSRPAQGPIDLRTSS